MPHAAQRDKLAPWTPETDRILLLAVLATAGNPSLPTIASYTGYSLNSVAWRFRTLKKEATSLREKSRDASGGHSPSVSKKRAHPTTTAPSPIKKRKTSPKGGKKRKVVLETSDEEPPTPSLSESEEGEQTPSLHDDEDDETSASSVEPVTPTKVLPRRKAKPAPGYYRQLDEGSELDLEESDIGESQL
ncbi:hypothetical protein TWF281_005666 [Arthrobotrys megalospora]